MNHHESVYRPDAIEIYLLVRMDEQILTLARATDHIYDCCDDVSYTGVIMAHLMEEGDRKIKADSGDGIFGETPDGTYSPIKFKEVPLFQLMKALNDIDKDNADDEYRFSAMEEGPG